MADTPAPDASAADSIWSGRNVLVAVTGGIACYKSATLVSRLIQAGAAVRVIMTEAATRFIGPLTFQSLTGRPVLTSIWQVDDQPESQHIGLARWAHLVIVAPATANAIAKFAHGLCDDIVSLTLAAVPQGTPVLLAPAMNSDMWANPAIQRNIQTVRDLLGYHMVGPEEGWQACRTKGLGRMSEPEAILKAAEAVVGPAR